MAETPTKTCRTCAQSFPATDEYFPRKGKSLRTYCRPCFRKVMDAYTLAAQQRTKAQKAAGQVPPKPKRHWTPNPTGKGLDPAVAKAPVRLPKAPQKVDESFRDVMLRRGRPQWEALADKILERALTGEASLLKYVGEMFLGDETGEQSTLAASLRQLHDVRLAELRRDHAAAWAALGLLNQALRTKEGPDAKLLHLSPEQQAPLFWTSGLPAGLPDLLAITGGVQSGKTTILSLEAVTRLPWLGPTPIWVPGPDYFQTRHERAALERFLGALGWVDWSNSVLPKAENEPWALRTVFGSTIRGLSGQKPETLAGESPSLILLAEAGQTQQAVFNVLHARATARGARFVLAGTYEQSQPWFRRLVRTWKGPNKAAARAFVLPSWANPAFYPAGQFDQAIVHAQQTMDPDTFLQRHAGQEPPVEGLVLASSAR